MTVMPVYVSIIIPTKNAGDRLDSVLKGIFASRVDFGYEVIVVDSGSHDNTKKIIERHPVKLIEIEPLSFSHGGSRNTGADNAAGEILVYLSQDAMPKDERWLASLVSGFKGRDTAGIFGRQIPDESSSALEKFFLQYVYPDYKIIKDSLNPDNCILQDIFFSDVNSAIRKSEWENNKFREDLIMSEDQAWSRDMLMKKKKIVYEPVAAVYHSHNYTIRRLMMRNFDSGLSLKGIIKAPFRRNLLYEIKYIKSAMLYFIKNRHYRYLFIFPFYECFRLSGFLAGRFSVFLPIWLKEIFSENKAYWEQVRYGNVRP
jgi:rhamnosyltransferase